MCDWKETAGSNRAFCCVLQQQVSPPPFNPGFVNYNMNAEAFVQHFLPYVAASRETVFTAVMNLDRLGSSAVNEDDHDAFHANFVDDMGNTTGYGHPHSVVLSPVFEKLNNKSSKLVGVIHSVVPWDWYLTVSNL